MLNTQTIIGTCNIHLIPTRRYSLVVINEKRVHWMFPWKDPQRLVEMSEKNENQKSNLDHPDDSIVKII